MNRYVVNDRVWWGVASPLCGERAEKRTMVPEHFGRYQTVGFGALGQG
jgi:hypothetical protein